MRNHYFFKKNSANWYQLLQHFLGIRVRQNRSVYFVVEFLKARKSKLPTYFRGLFAHSPFRFTSNHAITAMPVLDRVTAAAAADLQSYLLMISRFAEYSQINLF